MKNTPDTTGQELKMKWNGWGIAHLLYEDEVSKTVGRVLTFVETLGFNPDREKAVKDIIKREIYATLNNGWIIGDDMHHELRKKAYEFGQLSMGGYMPPEYPVVKGD